MTARSYLVVAGDRPERLVRALASGAHAVVWESPESTDTLADALMDLPRNLELPAELWVAVGAGDAGALAAATAVRAGAGVLRGVVAREAAVAALAVLDRVCGDAEQRAGLRAGAIACIPEIATAAGVLDARALAAAPRVARLSLDEAVVRASLGVETSEGGLELLVARSTLVLACAAAGIGGPIASASMDLGDRRALERSTEALGRLGFVGRFAVHPSQVPIIHEAFES